MDINDVVIPDDDNTGDVIQDTNFSDDNIPEWKGYLDENSSDVDIVDETPDDTTNEEGEDKPTDTTSTKQKFDPRTGDLIEEADKVPQDAETEVYTGLATILKSQGFFSEIEDLSTIKDSASLGTALDKEVQARLTDRQKEIMEYMNGGVPMQQVSKLQAALQETESITPDAITNNDVLAKNLIISDLTYKGIEQSQAEKFYDMMVKSGEVTSEALKALATRKETLSGMITKEVEGAKIAKQKEMEAEQQRAQELEKTLSSTEIFGRKIAPTTAERVKKLASTPVAYTKQGDPLNAVMKYRLDNPIDFEHKLLYLFSVTNGFKDLNSFDRSAESRVSNSMKNAIKVMSSSEDFTSNRPSNRAGTTINIDDIDDII